MSSFSGNAHTESARRPEAVVPAYARALAARLSALFDKDSRIVARLNGAQRRLRHANDRLWSGLAPDAFGLIYDGSAPAGHSQVAELIEDGGPAPVAPALSALQAIHWQIHGAFCEYQSACEERRQLAVEVGELAVLFRRHRADDSVNKAISKLIRSDLILIDDVGLLPVSADAAEA